MLVRSPQAVFPAITKAHLLAALKTLRTQHLVLPMGEGCYQLHAIVGEYAQLHFDSQDNHSNMHQLQEAHAKAAHYYQ